MRKIPVLRTIQAAYQFTLTHLGAIIGLIWLPMLLLTVIGFFVEQRYYSTAAEALASNNFARLGPAALGLLAYFVAALALYSMMYVALVQLALGQRKEPALIHFSFGAPEWRLFRASFGLTCFLFFPLLILGFLMGSVLSGALVQQLLQVLVGLGLIYIVLRFVFLLPALSVSEEGPLLPRAWILSAGNFWTIVAVTLATMAPVSLIGAVAQLALEGKTALQPATGSSSAMLAAQLHQMSLNMPANKGIEFLLAPLFLGLGAGASAFALQALNSKTED